uniref:Uncharacterized protein n=2 Tax=Rhodnius prolixus TaxID=13249 RepID=T1IFE8_RHOPR
MEQIVVKNKHLYQQNDQLSTQVKTQCQEIVVLREKIEAQAKLVAENWENGFSYSNKQEHFTEIETR